jgi:hypothetical protein
MPRYFGAVDWKTAAASSRVQRFGSLYVRIDTII